MKNKWIVIVLACLLASCELTNYIPPVTSRMATTSKGQVLDLAMLNHGRTLFVRRCIECHTLPALWHYSTGAWPEIVNSMSHRASLNSAERDAIVAYVLAVRSQR